MIAFQLELGAHHRPHGLLCTLCELRLRLYGARMLERQIEDQRVVGGTVGLGERALHDGLQNRRGGVFDFAERFLRNAARSIEMILTGVPLDRGPPGMNRSLSMK